MQHQSRWCLRPHRAREAGGPIGVELNMVRHNGRSFDASPTRSYRRVRRVTASATQIQHTFISEIESPCKKTTVNIRIMESFLSDVDLTWKELGYSPHSEFIRDVFRDAVKHPNFNRNDPRAMLAGEVDI